MICSLTCKTYYGERVTVRLALKGRECSRASRSGAGIWGVHVEKPLHSAGSGLRLTKAVTQCFLKSQHAACGRGMIRAMMSYLEDSAFGSAVSVFFYDDSALKSQSMSFIQSYGLSSHTSRVIMQKAIREHVV